MEHAETAHDRLRAAAFHQKLPGVHARARPALPRPPPFAPDTPAAADRGPAPRRQRRAVRPRVSAARSNRATRRLRPLRAHGPDLPRPPAAPAPPLSSRSRPAAARRLALPRLPADRARDPRAPHPLVDL